MSGESVVPDGLKVEFFGGAEVVKEFCGSVKVAAIGAVELIDGVSLAIEQIDPGGWLSSRNVLRISVSEGATYSASSKLARRTPAVPDLIWPPVIWRSFRPELPRRYFTPRLRFGGWRSRIGPRYRARGGRSARSFARKSHACDSSISGV
jgi:hypothetical protein